MLRKHKYFGLVKISCSINLIAYFFIVHLNNCGGGQSGAIWPLRCMTAHRSNQVYQRVYLFNPS